jgi:flotillin
VNKVQYQSLATALNGADLKLLVNSGDVHSGLGKFSDILSSKGGSATTGLFESLKQTAEGAGLVSLLEKFTNKDGSK